MTKVSTVLETKFHGFKPCIGGEELSRAMAILSGASVRSNPQGSSITLLPSHHHQEDISVRELFYAARQYESIVHSHPEDYDTLYNYGLVLQELASRVPGSPDQHQARLELACEKYEAALKIRPNAHAALYNWGVALSDLARCLRDVSAAKCRSCLALASSKYASSLAQHPVNPQALNNWGLVLQELSNEASLPAQHERLLAAALSKFRAALRQRPDFDRGVYNLGTVLYGWARQMQEQASEEFKDVSVPPAVSSPAELEVLRQRQARDTLIRNTFTLAAQYICLAAAMQPYKEVYRKSLALVKSLLPLPFLRAGYLTAPVATSSPSSHRRHRSSSASSSLQRTSATAAAAAPVATGPAASSLAAMSSRSQRSLSESWPRRWFVLDHVSLRSASSMESSLSTATGALSGVAGGAGAGGRGSAEDMPLVVQLADMTRVERVADPSLPAGEALWVGLRHMAEGVYLVADDAESADAWTDALVLSLHISHTYSPDVLAEALQPSHRRTAAAQPPSASTLHGGATPSVSSWDGTSNAADEGDQGQAGIAV